MLNLNKLVKNLNFEQVDEVLAKGVTTTSCSTSTDDHGADCGVVIVPPPVERPPIGAPE